MKVSTLRPLSMICLLGAANLLFCWNSRPIFNKYLLTYICMNQFIRHDIFGQTLLVDHFQESNVSEKDTGDSWSSEYLNRREVELDSKRDLTQTTNLSTDEGLNKQDNAGMGNQITTLLPERLKENYTTDISNIEQSTTVIDSLIAPGVSFEFYSKSKVYNAMVESLPFTLFSSVLQRLSCKNICGNYSRKQCSCKPSCLYLKTCCYDFLEACSKVYDLIQFNNENEWLQSVETQCLSASVVVNSCPVNNKHSKHNDHGQFSRNTDAIDNFPIDMSTFVNTSNKLTLVNMMLVLSKYQVNNSFQNEWMQMLTNTPIVDMSTGISYRNISIYTCNGANLSRAFVWLIYYDVNATILAPLSTIQTAEDIINMLNVTTYRARNPLLFAERFHKGFHSMDFDLCESQAFQTCSERFYGSTVDRACRNLNLYIQTTSMYDEGNHSTLIYRNPFCLFCNDDLQRIRKQIEQRELQLTLYDMKDSILYNEKSHAIVFEFDLRNQNTEFFIHLDKTHNDIGDSYQPFDIYIPFEYNLIPLWKGLTCPFHYSNNSEIGLTATNESRLISLLSGARCQSYECLYSSHFHGNKCVYLYSFALGLPPAGYELSDDYLNDVIKAWIQLLVHNVPYLWNHTDPVDTEIHMQEETDDIVGEQYYNFLVVHLDNELLYKNQSSFLNLLKEPVQEMLMKLDFPFQKRYNNVCLVAYVNEFIPQACDNEEHVVIVYRNVTEPETELKDGRSSAVGGFNAMCKNHLTFSAFVLLHLVYSNA